MRRQSTTIRSLRWGLLLAAAALTCLPAVAGEWRYRVRQGENLWTIADANLTGLQWLRPLQELNNVADPMRLAPGRELLIPLAWTRRTQVTATVDSVSGSVTRGAEPITKESRLTTGDVIRTGKASVLNLRYPDGSLTRIYADAEVELEQLEMLGRSAQLVARLDVRRGYTESIVRPGSVVRSSDVRVSTPYSSTSVRGTHFRVGSLPDSKTAVTGVLHGRVQVAGSHQARSIAVAEGQGTHVRDGERMAARPLLAAPSLAGVPDRLEMLPLRVDAGAIAGAAAYRADLAPQDAPEQIIASADSGSPGITFPDVPDGNYRLRLRAVDREGLEGQDASREVVIDAKPEPPFLMQPTVDAVVPAGDVGFRWASRKDAREYAVEVFKANDKGEPVGTALHTLRSDKAEAKLSLAADGAGSAYTWRARTTTDAEGQGPFGGYSSFKVVPPGPGVQAPGFNGKLMQLGWARQPHAAKWRVQLARDAEFTTLQHDAEVSEPKISINRPPAGNYQVRIAWVDHEGRQGPWSQPQEIQVPARKPWWLLIPAALLLAPML